MSVEELVEAGDPFAEIVHRYVVVAGIDWYQRHKAWRRRAYRATIVAGGVVSLTLLGLTLSEGNRLAGGQLPTGLSGLAVGVVTVLNGTTDLRRKWRLFTAAQTELEHLLAEWDVAARLGRTPQAVRRAVERGELPTPEVRLARRRWRPATILEWEEQRRIACLRWPLQPLLDTCGYSAIGLARAVGVSQPLAQHFARWGLPDRIADDWAVRLGYHPVEVWGWDWVTAALSARPDDGDAA